MKSRRGQGRSRSDTHPKSDASQKKRSFHTIRGLDEDDIRGYSTYDDSTALEYERRPRKSGDFRDLQSEERLPFKINGEVVRRKSTPNDQSGSLSMPASNFRDEENGDPVLQYDRSETSSKQSKGKGKKQEESRDKGKSMTPPVPTLHSAEEIASVCALILQDPDAKLNRLEEILATLKEARGDFLRLVALSCVKLFTNLAPGYRIRLLTEKEETAKVSKDVLRTRRFEQSLLRFYQQFLSVLDTLTSESSTADQQSRCLIGVLCFCDLLVSLPHFNFTPNIIISTLRFLQLKKHSQHSSMAVFSEKVANLICDQLISLFEQHGLCSTSLEVVEAIGELLASSLDREHPFEVFGRTVETFLYLPLRVFEHVADDDDEKSEEKQKDMKKPFVSGKQRGNQEDQQKHNLGPKNAPFRKSKLTQEAQSLLDEDLREAQARTDPKELKKLNKKLLESIVASYFRVIRHATGVRERLSENGLNLLFFSLEGLARFAPLVDVDILFELLVLLEDFIPSTCGTETSFDIFGMNADVSNRRRVLVYLRCILTCLVLLTREYGQAINIDPRGYYQRLYSLIFPLLSSHHVVRAIDDGQIAPLFIAALILLQKSARQMPKSRLAAFIQRSLISSLYCTDTAFVESVLSGCMTLSMTDPTLEVLLDGDESSSVFRIEVDDPDTCNALSSSIWPLVLLSKSVSPSIRKNAASFQNVGKSEISASQWSRIAQPNLQVRNLEEELASAFRICSKFSPPHKTSRAAQSSKHSSKAFKESLEKRLQIADARRSNTDESSSWNELFVQSYLTGEILYTMQ